MRRCRRRRRHGEAVFGADAQDGQHIVLVARQQHRVRNLRQLAGAQPQTVGGRGARGMGQPRLLVLAHASSPSSARNFSRDGSLEAAGGQGDVGGARGGVGSSAGMASASASQRQAGSAGLCLHPSGSTDS